jgi:hypothetical protein
MTLAEESALREMQVLSRQGGVCHERVVGTDQDYCPRLLLCLVVNPSDLFMRRRRNDRSSTKTD